MTTSRTITPSDPRTLPQLIDDVERKLVEKWNDIYQSFPNMEMQHALIDMSNLGNKHATEAMKKVGIIFAKDPPAPVVTPKETKPAPPRTLMEHTIMDIRYTRPFRSEMQRDHLNEQTYIDILKKQISSPIAPYALETLCYWAENGVLEELVGAYHAITLDPEAINLIAKRAATRPKSFDVLTLLAQCGYKDAQEALKNLNMLLFMNLSEGQKSSDEERYWVPRALSIAARFDNNEAKEKLTKIMQKFKDRMGDDIGSNLGLSLFQDDLAHERLGVSPLENKTPDTEILNTLETIYGLIFSPTFVGPSANIVIEAQEIAATGKINMNREGVKTWLNELTTRLRAQELYEDVILRFKKRKQQLHTQNNLIKRIRAYLKERAPHIQNTTHPTQVQNVIALIKEIEEHPESEKAESRFKNCQRELDAWLGG